MSEVFKFPNIPKRSQVGHFEILDTLSADGNMSRTFVGRNSQGKKVVIKIAQGNDISVNFLKEEVEQLIHLRHPSISQILPIHRQPHQQPIYIGRIPSLEPYFNGVAPYYYVMELLEGKSLQNNLRQVWSLPIEWRIELIYQIALAIHYLHLNNIAHMDLKPDNIVFRTSPQKGVLPTPVLVDFGIASRHNYRTFKKTGTVQYMSPERIEDISGQKASYRTTLSNTINHLPSDVWSLGVIAYELLSLKHPFAPSLSTPQETIIDNILHNPPKNIPNLPEELNIILFGKPTNNHHQDTEGGMLSYVREGRIEIFEAIHAIDQLKQFQPPRY